ncbi:MAG: glutaredoxin 3 [Proteobacteria bacterium]|nr:glutaredoxin 3 [Pseudomonadota bacterium]
MARVEIYATDWCPYCVQAKRLLAAKGAAFEEIALMREPERMDEMIARANGRRTVPQIFVDGRHIGGWEELHALERAGGLDPLLAGAA